MFLAWNLGSLCEHRLGGTVPASARHGHPRAKTRVVALAIVLLITLAFCLVGPQAGRSCRPTHKVQRFGARADLGSKAFACFQAGCHPARTYIFDQQSWHQQGQTFSPSALARDCWCSKRGLRSSVRRYAATDTVTATPAEMQDAIQLASSLRAQWKLKQAVDILGVVVSAAPLDMVKNTNDETGVCLKYAMMLRAEWRLLMGDVDESIADFGEVLKYLPADRDARIQLAHAVNDGNGDAERALSLVSEVLDEGPNGVDGDIGDIKSYTWAAQDAGVFAASLGKHDVAQSYFELFRKHLCDLKPRRYKYIQLYRKSADDMKRYVQGVFYEMVNAHIIGDTERAAAAGEFHKTMILSEHPELAWFRPVFTSSWELIASVADGKARGPSLFYSTRPMLQLAMDMASLDGGLILELGVWHGTSLRMTALNWPDDPVHGFDTFTGLPEAWGTPETGGEPAGAYSTFGATPTDLPHNVHLHAGLFSDTLPGFIEAHPGPIRFMNIDCDLYSSTKDIFDQVSERVVPGTIIVFDEYLMTPTWQDDEFKAFQEAVVKNGWSYEYVAFSIMTGQAIVRIT